MKNEHHDLNILLHEIITWLDRNQEVSTANLLPALTRQFPIATVQDFTAAMDMRTDLLEVDVRGGLRDVEPEGRA